MRENRSGSGNPATGGRWETRYWDIEVQPEYGYLYFFEVFEVNCRWVGLTLRYRSRTLPAGGSTVGMDLVLVKSQIA